LYAESSPITVQSNNTGGVFLITPGGGAENNINNSSSSNNNNKDNDSTSDNNNNSNSNNAFAFAISLVQIYELSAEGERVHSYNLTNTLFNETISAWSGSAMISSNSTLNISSLSTTTLSQTLPNGATLILNITLFPSAVTFTFATQTMSLSPYTAKLTIQVSNWPFSSLRGFLAFEIVATLPGYTGVTQIALSPITESGVSWISLIGGKSTLYQQFIGMGLLDGHPKMVTTFQKTGTNSVIITVPFFLD